MHMPQINLRNSIKLILIIHSQQWMDSYNCGKGEQTVYKIQYSFNSMYCPGFLEVMACSLMLRAVGWFSTFKLYTLCTCINYLPESAGKCQNDIIYGISESTK